MTRQEKIEATDAIVRDLFAKGGPQRPVSAGWYTEKKPAHRECPALLREQRRLIRTWGR
jgi:hypothetical protein